MQKKPMISLRPLADATWFTHEESGARFKVAALDPETDQRFNRESIDPDGKFNLLAFYGRVMKHCLKDWDGINDNGVPAPCNETNIALLHRHHATNYGPFICTSSRSLTHFIEQETEAAKND